MLSQRAKSKTSPKGLKKSSLLLLHVEDQGLAAGLALALSFRNSNQLIVAQMLRKKKRCLFDFLYVFFSFYLPGTQITEEPFLTTEL